MKVKSGAVGSKFDFKINRNAILAALCGFSLAVPGLPAKADVAGQPVLALQELQTQSQISPQTILQTNSLAAPDYGSDGLPDLHSSTAGSISQGDSLTERLSGAMRGFIEEKGKALLTPDGAASVLQQSGSGFKDSVAAVGGGLAQSAINAGLQQLEDYGTDNIFRSLSLNYSPSLAGRKALFQADAMLSLLERDEFVLLSQLGVQSRSGEAGVNVGLVGRTRAIGELVLGGNIFYDHLSDPDVSRWSVGADLRGRWFTFAGNYYNGSSDDRVGNVEYYSPDGWDVSVSGHVPDFPWLEYTGRYYQWDVDHGNDLDGTDYKLTFRPVPLASVSARYDNPETGSSDFGLELQLNYSFRQSMQEQLDLHNVQTPENTWERRFERVQREYEQRVQQRVAGGTRSRLNRASCAGTACSVSVGNAPAGTTRVIVTARGGTPGRLGGRRSLTRSYNNCELRGVAAADPAPYCTYQEGNPPTLMFFNLPSEEYTFDIDFRDSGNQSMGTAQVTATPATVLADLISSVDILPVTEGGSASYTLRLNRQPTETVSIALFFRTRLLAVDTNPSENGNQTTLEFTVDNWNTAQTITVMAPSNDIPFSPLYHFIRYSAAGGGYSGEYSPQRVLLTDSNAEGERQVVVARLAAGSGGRNFMEGSTVSIDVFLTKTPESPVTVAVVPYSNNSARTPQDYVLSHNSVTLSGDNLATTITVTIVDDTEVEETESVGLSFEPPEGAEAATVFGVNFNITDNDVHTDAANNPPEVSAVTVTPQGGSPVSSSRILFTGYSAGFFLGDNNALPLGTTSVTVNVTLAGNGSYTLQDRPDAPVLSINGNTISGLVGNLNEVIMNVVSPSGNSERYILFLVVAQNQDNSVASVSVDTSGAEARSFTATSGSGSGEFTYSVSVPRATTEVTVFVTPNDSGASVPYAIDNESVAPNLTVTHDRSSSSRQFMVAGLQPGDNSVYFTVVSPDGYGRRYGLTVSVAVSTSASLSSIAVTPSGGSPVQASSSGANAYSVTLPSGTSSINVAATTADGSTVAITAPDRTVAGSTVSGLRSGANAITVTVTAEDGSTQRQYTLTVTVISNDNSLSSVSVIDSTGEQVELTVMSSGNAYSVSAPVGTMNIEVEATATDSNAMVVVSDAAAAPALTINGQGISGLQAGANAITITVTAQDGTVASYTLTVTVAS